MTLPPRRALERLAMLAIFTNFIVFGAFIGTFQCFIRFVDVLELSLGVLFLAYIRVIFARQLAIGGLDRLDVSRGLDTQDLVIVFEVHVRITIRYQYGAAATSQNAPVGQPVV